MLNAVAGAVVKVATMETAKMALNIGERIVITAGIYVAAELLSDKIVTTIKNKRAEKEAEVVEPAV